MFGYDGYGLGPMGGGSGFNAWTWIILILIVLQWFRVDCVGGAPGGAEHGLIANGGLFIIALFLLVACGCFKGAH